MDLRAETVWSRFLHELEAGVWTDADEAYQACLLLVKYGAQSHVSRGNPGLEGVPYTVQHAVEAPRILQTFFADSRARVLLRLLEKARPTDIHSLNSTSSFPS